MHFTDFATGDSRLDLIYHLLHAARSSVRLACGSHKAKVPDRRRPRRLESLFRVDGIRCRLLVDLFLSRDGRRRRSDAWPGGALTLERLFSAAHARHCSGSLFFWHRHRRRRRVFPRRLDRAGLRLALGFLSAGLSGTPFRRAGLHAARRAARADRNGEDALQQPRLDDSFSLRAAALPVSGLRALRAGGKQSGILGHAVFRARPRA